MNGIYDRKVVVPERIIITDGTDLKKVVEFKNTDGLEYLKLCISMKFYNEDGMI